MRVNEGRVPNLDVSLDGHSLDHDELHDLSGLRVSQRLTMPAQCELHFRGEGGNLLGAHDEETWLTPGHRLTVCVGDEQELLFDGELTAAEYAYGAANEVELYLRGYDLLHRLRERQDVAGYPETSLRGLARRMLADLPRRAGLELHGAPEFVWPLLIQHQQNNLEFLVEIAAQMGLYPVMLEDTLHLLTLAGLRVEGDPLGLVPGENLLDVHLELNLDEVRSEVEVLGWSAGRAQAERRRATVGAAEMWGPAGANGPNRHLGTRTLINENAESAGQAEMLARAELAWRRATKRTLWGRATGDVRLHPGAVVTVEEVAPAVAGRYVITEAIHRIDDNGYVTEFSTRPPEIPPRPRCDVATLGRVTHAADLEGAGRVRVELPAYSNVETGWLPVAYPGGGNHKGLFSPPGAGDTVLVLLLRENPAHGVVLGGLYGGSDPPDRVGILEAGRRWTLSTAGGQTIQLSEHGDAVRLHTDGGAAIELHGDNVVITGARIDFRKLE